MILGLAGQRAIETTETRTLETSYLLNLRVIEEITKKMSRFVKRFDGKSRTLGTTKKYVLGETFSSLSVRFNCWILGLYLFSGNISSGENYKTIYIKITINICCIETTIFAFFPEIKKDLIYFVKLWRIKSTETTSKGF